MDDEDDNFWVPSEEIEPLSMSEEDDMIGNEDTDEFL